MTKIVGISLLIYQGMKIIYSILGILVWLTSCGAIKSHPDYKGVDPAFAVIVNEYKNLAKSNDIVFDHEVTAGFTRLGNSKDRGLTIIIGQCNYGMGFREIDIDPDFWFEATPLSKKMLLFHELSHCYCKRRHDYKNGAYSESESARQFEIKHWHTLGLGSIPGHFVDGCPVSLMYPVIVDDACSVVHYLDYVKEMFNNCNPY